MMRYGYGMMDGWGWYNGWTMVLFGILLFVGIVLLVMWATGAFRSYDSRRGVPPMTGQSGHDEAIATARRRLASGDITPEQYDEIMRALGR